MGRLGLYRTSLSLAFIGLIACSAATHDPECSENLRTVIVDTDYSSLAREEIVKAIHDWEHAGAFRAVIVFAEVDVKGSTLNDINSFQPDTTLVQRGYPIDTDIRANGGYTVWFGIDRAVSFTYPQVEQSPLWPGVIRHELGHSFGLPHSLDPHSIMFTPVEVNEISDMDISALCKLWTTCPGNP